MTDSPSLVLDPILPLCPCAGLPTARPELLEWYSDASASKSAAAMSVKVTFRKGARVLRSIHCTDSTTHPSGMCPTCVSLWVHKSQKGRVYNSFMHWLSRRSNDKSGQARFKFSQKVVRKQRTRRLKRDVESAVKKSVSNLNPVVKQFVRKAQKLVVEGKLTEDDLSLQLLQLNNVWRKGKSVHGRRYPGLAGQRLLAASAFTERRQATWVQGLLAANAMYTMPGKLTIKRRNSTLSTPTFSLQPPEAFSCLTNWTSQPSHVCCDEVAVNQVVDSIPSTNPPGYEVAGLSNRCMRENNPEGVQYIMKDEGGVLVRTTRVEDGSVVVSEKTEDKEFIDSLSGIPPATLLCVWIILDPVRGKRSFIAATVPSCGDLTTSDDAVMLHNIIQRAHDQGRMVSFFGADNAAPHAALARGIIRRMSIPEADTLLSTLESTSSGEGTGEYSDWESLAISLVPKLQRPISVIQHLLRNLTQINGTKRQRIDQLLADQWTVPYQGLPYAFQKCAITGGLLGISPEWRHDNRLMVRMIIDNGMCP